MKHKRSWIGRLVWKLGIAVLVVLSLMLLLGPAIMQHVIAAQVEKFGLPRPRLRASGNFLTQLEISRLSVGEDDRLSIGSLGINYTPWQLLSKRIDTVEIAGLEVEIRQKNGAWDLGPLASLHGSTGGEMPFGRITLRASTLILDLDGRRLRIAVSGSLENAGSAVLTLDLKSIVEGITLRLGGTIDTGSGDFAFTLDGETADLSSALTVFAPSYSVHTGAWGGLTGKAAVLRDQGVLKLDAAAQGDGWQLSGITVRESGLENWFRGQVDSARVEIHAEGGIPEPGRFIEKFFPTSELSGQTLGKGDFGVDGILELGRTPVGPEQRGTWSAVIPAARMTLGSGDWAMPASGINLKGVSANVHLAATANSESLRVNLLPDSWIIVTSAEVLAGKKIITGNIGKFVVKEDDNQPLLAVTRAENQAAMTIGAFVIEAAEPIAISDGEGINATLAAVRSVVEGTWSDGNGSWNGELRISGIHSRLQERFENHILNLNVPDASLLVKIKKDFSPGLGKPVTMEFVAGTTAQSPGVQADIAGVEAAAGTFEVRGIAALADGQPPAVSARVSLANAAAVYRDIQLAISGIEAEVPLAWNAAAALEPGHLTVKSVAFQETNLPSISGVLSITDAKADFGLAWEPLPGAKLRVEGSAAAGAAGPSARAYISLPLFEITDENALGELTPQLQGLLVRGSFALDGYMRWSSKGLLPNMALTVLDGSFKSKAWDAEAQGVYATIRINSVTPLLTPHKELQVVLVRRAAMGKLEVKDGFAAFRLEPKKNSGPAAGWSAYVQHGECGWVGGRLYIDDFRWDPEAPEHMVTVFARDLKLGALLGLIPDQRASGVGSLDGQVHVTIGQWPDLQFGEGELRTATGQSGWFKVKDTEVLGSVLEGADPRFQSDSLYIEIKKRLINAFKDFEYDEVSVMLKQEGERRFARVNTKGRARTGEGQEFESVTLNFFDFDKTLRDVILISREIQALQ